MSSYVSNVSSKIIRHGQKPDLPQLRFAAVKKWVFVPGVVCKDDQTLSVAVKHYVYYKKIEKNQKNFIIFYSFYLDNILLK